MRNMAMISERRHARSFLTYISGALIFDMPRVIIGLRILAEGKNAASPA